MEARVAKKSYLEVEWYLCENGDCDGPRGTGEASIRTLRVEESDREDDAVQVSFLGSDAFYIVPRVVLKEMAKA